MLLTDERWAECHPIRRAIARPYQPWRCVGWTDETLNFLVVISRNLRDHASLPDGWLIGGPEALIESVSQCVPGSFSVYVLDRAADDARVDLCRVTGIWRERQEKQGDEPWIWYSTDSGELRPCSRVRLGLEAQPELVIQLNFESSFGARQSEQ